LLIKAGFVGRWFVGLDWIHCLYPLAWSRALGGQL
jgi:hypothetical protein